MTVKEQLVDIIMSQGYDLLTACELAEECIKEFKACEDQQMTYTIGNRRFILKKITK